MLVFWRAKYNFSTLVHISSLVFPLSRQFPFIDQYPSYAIPELRDFSLSFLAYCRDPLWCHPTPAHPAPPWLCYLHCILLHFQIFPYTISPIFFTPCFQEYWWDLPWAAFRLSSLSSLSLPIGEIFQFFLDLCSPALDSPQHLCLSRTEEPRTGSRAPGCGLTNAE